MAKQINTSVGGVKKASKVFACIGGVVKTVKKGLAGVGGVVKEFFVSELVLWDGSSLQNGATKYMGAMVEYPCTAGSLSGKSIVFKLNKTVSSATLRVITKNTTNTYFHVNGNTFTDVNSAYSTWSAGTEYKFSCSKIPNISTVDNIRIGIYLNTGDHYSLQYLDYIKFV